MGCTGCPQSRVLLPRACLDGGSELLQAWASPSAGVTGSLVHPVPPAPEVSPSAEWMLMSLPACLWPGSGQTPILSGARVGPRSVGVVLGRASTSNRTCGSVRCRPGTRGADVGGGLLCVAGQAGPHKDHDHIRS